jgi:hypothetical protein
MKKYKTYNNTILIQGKKYRWSGLCGNLYSIKNWENIKCKITKIDGDTIFIYDYHDNKELEFTNEILLKNKIIFCKNNIRNIFKNKKNN